MTLPSTSALRSAASLLAAAGAGTADLDALAKAAGGDDDLLLVLARRRAEGTPLAHLTGVQRFLGLELLAEPGVLVPRPETELLARTAIEALRSEGAGELRVLDLCCGAANLACAVASQLPTARVWASDISPAAVKLARRNALHTGLAARVHVVEGDLFAPLAGMALEASLDAIVCNPPYISTRRLETERAGLLRHEPREAFDGGPYGLSVHQRVARESAAYLKPGGTVLFEAGEGQHRQVMLLLSRVGAWADPETRCDDHGIPRVVLARRKVG